MLAIYRRMPPWRKLELVDDAIVTSRLLARVAAHTILRKLLWYRAGGEVSERQWADVLRIAGAQGDRLDRELLARWATQLGIEDLLARVLRPQS